MAWLDIVVWKTMVALPRAIGVAALVLLLPLPAAASVLGLMPSEIPLQHPSQHLSAEEAFAALDRAEARRNDHDGGSSQTLLEVALLAAATGRPEDRLYAIETLEAARDRDPDRLDLLLWQAELRARSQEFRPAAALLDRAEDRFAEVAEFHFARGLMHWLDARRHLGPESLRRAARDFTRAAELRPDHLPFARAVAAVALLEDRVEEGLRVLPASRAGARVDVATLLLQGVLLSTQPDQEERAEQLVVQAIRALPPAFRAVFEDGGGMLPGVAEGDPDAAARFWWERNPHPTRLSNSRRLLFWRRLLEADLLFGDRESGTPGWQTTPGQAWVRWGRPSAQFFQPPDAITFELAGGNRRMPDVRDPEALSVAPPSGGPQTDAREYTSRGRIDNSSNISRWIWSYGYGDESFQLVFNDLTHNSNWRMQGASAALHESMVRERSVILPTPVAPSDFELALSVTGRMPTSDRSAVDAAIAVLPSVDSDPSVEPDRVRVDWALFEPNGRRIDRGRIDMGAERSRDALLERAATGAATGRLRPARVARVGLSLDPGRYLLAVEATDTTTGSHEWARSVVTLARRPATGPALSDLQLTGTFLALEGPTDLPREFVRYAQFLVPLAERRLPATQESAFVYFEAYDLALDETGSTRIRVDYEISPAERGGTSASELARHRSFVEESTGQTPEGVVVKGTRLDLKGLEPGFYELVVRLTDLVAAVEMRRSLGFEIVGAERGLGTAGGQAGEG